VDVNSAVGRKAGLTDEKLLTVAQSARAPQGDFDFSIFNEKERLTIELADAMADTPSNISDELFRRLREEFSEEHCWNLAPTSPSRIFARATIACSMWGAMTFIILPAGFRGGLVPAALDRPGNCRGSGPTLNEKTIVFHNS